MQQYTQDTEYNEQHSLPTQAQESLDTLSLHSNTHANGKEVPINKQDRSYHASYVRKKRMRIKVRMLDGSYCIGDCHVVWPDGRSSDVINDDRSFLILTDATVEGRHNVYNVLTINKERIEMIFEIHHPKVEPFPSSE